MHFVFVVDISGSMGTSVESSGGENNGFSILDLVKHSLFTIVESLGNSKDGSKHTVTLVTFTDV